MTSEEPVRLKIPKLSMKYQIIGDSTKSLGNARKAVFKKYRNPFSSFLNCIGGRPDSLDSYLSDDKLFITECDANQPKVKKHQERKKRRRISFGVDNFQSCLSASTPRNSINNDNGIDKPKDNRGEACRMPIKMSFYKFIGRGREIERFRSDIYLNTNNKM
ncbi:hypothetical protein GJ496_000119 [Pomphorhynchus laevis]|nr:hypothetical protein GJ496_000119 [Pomphorhynchus laevis]